MKFFVDTALRIVDLEEEARAIDTLGRLRASWPEIKNAIPAIRDTDDLFTLLIQLDQHIEAERAQLAAAGIDVGEMLALSKRLKSLWENSVPPALRKLLRPVGEFSEFEHGDEFGEVQWRPLRLAQARAGTLAGNTIGFRPRLNANAAVEVEAGAIAPAELSPETAYLRFGFGGDVAVGLDLQLPLSFGLMSRSSSESSAALDYWFALEPDELASPFLVAAGARIRSLPNPFSLKSLWAAADASFAAGRISTSAGFSQTMSMRFSLKGLLGGSFDGNMIDVVNDTLEFGAQIVRNRTYDMSILAVTSAAGQKSLRLRVNRARRLDRQSGAALSIVLDAGEIADKAAQVFDSYLSDYQALRRRYGKYLRAGTLLATELESQLDKALRTALTGDSALKELMRAAIGDERARNSALQGLLRRWLTQPAEDSADRLGSLLDQGMGLIGSEADKVAERLIARITEAFGEGAGAALRPQIEGLAHSAQEDLAALVGDLQDSIDAHLGAEVAELFEAGGAAAKRAFDQLDEFAARAGQAVQNAAASLDAAQAGVRNFVAAVDAKIAALTNALLDATHQRLQLRISNEEKLSLGASANLEIEFSADNPKTRRLFDRITRGEFDGDTLAAMRTTQGVNPLSGQLEYFAQSHSRRAIEIGFMSFTGAQASVFDSRVSIAADLDGNIVVNNEIATSRRLGGARESQQIAFLSPFDLHTAKLTRVLTTSLTASQEDANYEISEIEDFLDDFERLELISPATLAAAVQQLAQWRQAAGNDDFRARVDIALALDAEAMDTLFASVVAASDDGPSLQQEQADRRMVGIVLDALVDAGAYERATVVRAARHLRDLSRAFRHLSEPEDVFSAVRLTVLDGRRATRESQAFTMADFGTTHAWGGPRLLRSPRGALRHAANIHLLVKSYAVAMKSLKQIYELDPASGRGFAEQTEQIDATNRLVGFSLKPWLRPSRRFLWLPNDEIHAVSHAFFLALATQAGLLSRAAVNESIMSVVLRVPGDNARTRIF